MGDRHSSSAMSTLAQYATTGNTTVMSLSTTSDQNTENLFVLMSAALVFLMHVGFAVFECGNVQAKNRQSIVFKNIINLLATAFAWWSLGYMVFGPYGLSSSTNDSWFMGTERAWGDTPAFLGSVPKTGELLLTWFYGFLMAATSAMIASAPSRSVSPARALFSSSSASQASSGRSLHTGCGTPTTLAGLLPKESRPSRVPWTSLALLLCTWPEDVLPSWLLSLSAPALAGSRMVP